MEILINQQLTEVPGQLSVQELIASMFSVPPKGIALAVNQQVIPKTQWATCIILPDDKITVITATQGG